jgi:hypothetical protein
LTDISVERSTTSFLSTDDADVALDLTVDGDDERLVFTFCGRREGEWVALARGSSLIRPARAELNSSLRSPSSDESRLTSIVSPFTDSALGLRLDPVAIAVVGCCGGSVSEMASK